jgi:2-succinyl-5-enolpyruvyl-6-hydroxy-3-cyclohexene-1-carboxylate synthase
VFGLPYSHPATRDDFAATYQKARAAGRSAVIEISGDRKENFEQHELIRSRLPAYLLTKRRIG